MHKLKKLVSTLSATGIFTILTNTIPCFAQFTVQSFGPATWNSDPALIDAATGMTGATFETFEDLTLDPTLSISYNAGAPTSDVTYDSMLDPRWDGNVGFSLVLPGTPITTCMAERLEIVLAHPRNRIGFGISLMEIGPGFPSPHPTLLVNGQGLIDFIALPNYANGGLERNVYVVVTAEPGNSISSFGIANPGSCDRVMMDRIGWFPCPSVTLIQTQPVPTTTCPTGMATFNVTASSAGQLAYSWERETVPNSNVFASLADGSTLTWDGDAPGAGAIVSGASSASLTIAADTANQRVLTAAHAIRYRCTIIDECAGTISSEAALLTIQVAPTISIEPTGQAVCSNGTATFSVTASASPPPIYQWRKNSQPITGATNAQYTIDPVTANDAGEFDCIVSNSCGTVTSNLATLTVPSDEPDARYHLTTLCPTSSIASPTMLGFTDDGILTETQCAGQRSFRLFAGRTTDATGKISRIRQNCTVAQFGPTLCGPESVLIDVNGRWPLSPAPLPNLIIAGGACNTIYFINPTSGGVTETFDDPSFNYIGQMAVDSQGRLFVGSLNGNALNVIDMGVTEPFWSAPGLSPRAVALDADDNVYLTCSVDGVMRKIDPLGNPININFATGLQGATSQAFAPPGIFHANLFVACGDRVMEVDPMTGATTTFLSCRQGVTGIAFDPEGFMYISEPAQNRIYKIGPGLPGDMNGDGFVNLNDLPNFVAALLQQADSLRPIMTADMNGDECADGADIPSFIDYVIAQ